MDNLDLEILDILKKNSRIGLKEIAESVHLSQPAIAKRIQKMEDSGAIAQYTTILSDQYFDRTLHCITSLKLSGTKLNEEEFRDYVRVKDEIISCHCVTGEYEYMLFIATKNTHTLEELLADIRMKFKIAHSNTIIVLSTQKNNVSI